MKSNKLLWILPLMFLLLISFASAVGTAPNSADTVAYWALEDLTDETGTYSLTNDGATSGATGIIDYAYSFDGVNDYMYTSDLGFEGQGTDVAFSVCFWAKSVDTDGVSMVHGGSDESRSWRVGWRGNEKLTFELYTDSSNYIVIDSPAYINTYDSSWTFYCVTYDGSETEGGMNMYINANKETTTSGSSGSYTGLRSSVVTYIGRLWDQSTYYEMDFDEVSIFDVALSSDEVSYLYNNGSPTSEQQYPYINETLENFIITTNLNNYSALIYGENINLDNITYINYTVVPITPLQDYYYYEIGGDAKNVFSNFSGTTVNVNECYNGSIVSLIRSDATPTDRWLCNGTIIQTTDTIPTLIKQEKYQTYSTTIGTIITELLQNNINLYNITLIPENTYYDNLTFTNYNVSENIDTNFTLQQSLITVNVYDIFGNLITDFNLTSGVETNSTSSVYVEHGENISINFSKSGWYNQTFYIGEVTGSRTVNLTGVYNSIVNINLTDIITTDLIEFSSYISFDDNLGTFLNYNNINGSFSLNISQGNYTLTLWADNYAYSYYNITIDNMMENLSYGLYANNSLWVTVKNQDSGLDLDNFTVTVYNEERSYYLDDNNTGIIRFNNITSGYYMVSVNKGGYSISDYYITMTGGSHLNIIAYLVAGGSSTVLTFVDSSSNGIIADAQCSMYKIINSSWEIVSSQLSDITGRIQFNYLDDIEYKFVVDAGGYEQKTFFLKPLYSTYTIRLTPEVLNIADVNTGDYVYEINNSGLFYNNLNNSFEISISSGTGTIEYYNMNVTNFDGTINSVSCNLATGCSDSFNFEIFGANFADTVEVEYSIKESGRSLKHFKKIYNIEDIYNKNTLFGWKDTPDSDVDSPSKAFIVVVVLLIVIGVISTGSILIGINPVLPSAIVLGLLVEVFAYVNFIPDSSAHLIALGCFLVILFGRGEI